jgi:hypothetical protein
MKSKNEFNKIISIFLLSMLIFGSFNYMFFNYTNAFYLDQAKTTGFFTASNDIEDYCPPHSPTLINPPSAEDNTPVNVLLQVLISDPNNDPMNVSFFDASTHECVDTILNVESGSIVSAEWNNLEFATTYSWYVTATDWEGTATSETWNFTTDHKPKFSQLVSPANNSINMNLSPLISINVSDPDDKTLNVTFFDSHSNVIDTCYNIKHTATSTWNNLSYTTTYSWYAIISDDITQTQSPTFTFTTMNEPSEPNPSPNPDSSPSNPNKSPTAMHNGPYTANISKPIHFNANDSTDEDGSIQSYLWDFGDNTTSENKTVNKTYTDIGSYTVSLTVTDDDGAASTVYTTALIQGLLIRDITVSPLSQRLNESVNISCFVTHSDPLQSVNLSIITPNETIINHSMSTVNGFYSQFYYNQTYTQTGEYTYYMTIVDEVNRTILSSTDSFTIYSPISPTITKVNTTPNIKQRNQLVNIQATISSPSPITHANVIIQKPDDTMITLQLTETETTGVYTISKAFNQTGNHTFSIQATNSDNLSNQTQNYTFCIINDTTPPVISNISIQPILLEKNSSVNINATVSDDFSVQTVFINITNPKNLTTYYVMNNSLNETYTFTKIFQQYGPYTFTITALDANDNRNTSVSYSFSIQDVTSPSINDITIYQNNQTIAISANVTDNTEVGMVSINITDPSNITVNYPMIHQNTSHYSFESTFSLGNYSYIIYATDIYGNEQQSIIEAFTIS